MSGDLQDGDPGPDPRTFIQIDDVSVRSTNPPFFNENLLTDDNFFSQIYQRTLGGSLKFIFMPDRRDPTNMYLAKFKDNSLKATQIAPSLYNISISIEEAF